MDKRRYVEDHLAQKARWLEKTFGKDVFDFKDFYFAGGCIYSLWNDKEIKDYDIFCKNKQAIKKLRKYFDKHKEMFDIITKNAISMGKFQFVIRNIGEPEQEVAKFDFLHNCYWYDSNGLHAVDSWEYLNSNKLKFNDGKARDILNVIVRIPKFISRGMEISQEETLKILNSGTCLKRYLGERKNIKKRIRGKRIY